jgi:hypothetical protein
VVISIPSVMPQRKRRGPSARAFSNRSRRRPSLQLTRLADGLGAGSPPRMSAHDASSDTPPIPHVRDDGSPVSPLYPQKDGGEFSRQILTGKITRNDVWNQPSVFTQATSARRTLSNVMTFRRRRFLGRQTTRTYRSPDRSRGAGLSLTDFGGGLTQSPVSLFHHTYAQACPLFSTRVTNLTPYVAIG